MMSVGSVSVFAAEAEMEQKVVMFGVSWCPYCAKAQSVF